ncbi:universal stress protein [Arthrobacter agilis]|uniref:universal stress protein n=1 Tax=Arthrobacter agilis TaxID=37921 RepID=UPI000B359E67|nr:universal stress protein [Arthrobacter agilis]OUM42918.1 universal stress protein UspA [Arthrobacter agilis]PPB45863.1 universal stress protein [Arthrobacter agilis]TPV25405.1 universal stress protein [Arthrobacter agilis]VDR33141.1 Universal stress protein family [Arthrobacter agilis]
MRYVVGYTENDRGQDALELATSMALTQSAGIDLVTVLDWPQDGSMAPGGRRAQEALDRARESVPDGVDVATHVRLADSFAQGLLELADDVDAGLIVIGASSSGLLRRFTVGSVANAVLHSSKVPVALAPRGYRHRATFSRMTCAVGTRPGAEGAVDVAVESAARRGLPLRLVSLVALDVHEAPDSGEAINQAHQHAHSVLARAAGQLPPGHEASIIVAHGRTIEQAIDDIEWDAGELVIVGSSRLAQHRQIFLGATANKMLRALPVPMVVVPRDWVRAER